MRGRDVGKRLMTAGIGSLLMLMLALSYTALTSIRTMRRDFDHTVTHSAHARFLAARLSKQMGDLGSLERGIIIRILAKEEFSPEHYAEPVRALTTAVEKDLNELRSLTGTENRSQLSDAQQQYRDILRLHEELMRALAASLDDGLATFRTETMPKILEFQGTCEEIENRQAENLKVAVAAAQANASRSTWIAFAFLGISLALGAAVVFLVHRITRQMQTLASDLGEGADQVAGAARQVSASSQSLAQGASEQAASLEETSAASEEINSMARKNTENSRSAADLVMQSQQKFVQTNQSLDQMVVSMEDINSQSAKISKIIKTIDEIAFQTNILALNAAVEAARAGEAGMGFAVVADEVRNLAQRSARAAKDTAALIEESIAKSNDGKTKVDQVATAIRAITGEAAKIKTLVDDVNLGSAEQAHGIEQIAKAIAGMEQVTQQNAANAEQSASASQQLNAQAESMREMAEKLHAMVGGVRVAPVR
jgi:methyl-accepting chemotaxis protein